MEFDADLELLGAIPAPLLKWYYANRRTLPWRSDPQPYHVWLSEIMLQQTRIDAVIDYYHRFLTALPTIADLAVVPEETLLKLWEGLGYYNRVRNLQKAARVVMERFGGELPADFDALCTLPGIGRYSAGAIGSIAFGLPVPAVDGNVLRVLTRVAASDANISHERVKKEVGRALMQVIPRDKPGDFTQALMELGALVCLPNGAPKCDVCPLKNLCKAHLLDIELSFPVKDEKRARTVSPRTIFVLLQEGRIAVRKRPSTGLLRGLWEFPGAEGALTEDEAADFLASIGDFSAPYPIGSAKHIFTHLEWHMTGFTAVCHHCKDKSLVWVTPEQLRVDYCLPSAFRAYTNQLTTLLNNQSDFTNEPISPCRKIKE